MKVFITGGTGSLGQDLVRGLVEGGHDVAFTYHANEECAATLVGDLSSATGRCAAFMLDVCDADAVDGVARAAQGQLGGVDMVINNAAVHAPKAAAWLSTADWKQVIDTNLNGSFYVARAFIEPFLAVKHGRFVHLGSVAARGMTGDVAYAASKAGLEGLSATLAREYGKYGVTSNVLMAGLADTGLAGGKVSDKLQTFWTEFCPAGRMMTALDVLNIVEFLGGAQSTFINGAVLPVTGGLDIAP